MEPSSICQQGNCGAHSITEATNLQLTGFGKVFLFPLALVLPLSKLKYYHLFLITDPRDDVFSRSVVNGEMLCVFLLLMLH